MATFQNLDFNAHPSRIGGEAARIFFPNGYGASVVRSQSSFGGREGLYELAVLKGAEGGDFELTYETPVTDDVLGYLTPEGVSTHLAEIEALPSAEGRS
jgi:hypothetical protein